MKLYYKALLAALLFFLFAVITNAAGDNASSTAATADFAFTRNLGFGIVGDDVSALQQFLIAGGFLKISTSTGYFGPLTKAAVGAWQASENIYPPAGFFGPISRGKINLAVQQAAAAAIQVPNISITTAPVGATSTADINNPVRLKIPKLGIDAGFQYNGLKSDGTMEIPTNIIDVGWFTGSPRPGEKGNSIITGHVAQIRGGVLIKPGVFSRLNELKAGDKLYVENGKGESIVFVVRESRNYDPAADATDVFESTDGGVHLNLITCEGTWSSDKLSYSQRLVVFTDLR